MGLFGSRNLRFIEKPQETGEIPEFENKKDVTQMGLFPAIICIVKEHGEAGLKTVPLFHAQFLERNDAMEEQINDELYGRMKAEQEAYRAELLAMPPDKILEHTWEYTAREDILEAVDSEVLPEEQMRSLLKSPSPLADVVKEYRDLDSPNEDILTAFENTANFYMEPPIYRQTAQYAMEHGEMDAYFASRKAYKVCARAIAASINKHFDGMHLDKECLSEAMEKYSPERIRDVLACTIQHKEWDGRFSRSNREWAMKADTSHMGKEPYQFLCESHPAILDGFVSMFRREVLEQKRDEKATAPAQHKLQERSDDFEL